uniref:Transmembrane protein n=1 Tax=Alexandrium andersonii TaxID=327968 RepID=A0A7S2D1D5_9DINO|mmetsp:Transcript_46326/g.105120  ORF Transcript_46326/g.105120 Transcript_46326/m.105120 type:complete len:239 (+) Transcript_46326:62-778(+)
MQQWGIPTDSPLVVLTFLLMCSIFAVSAVLMTSMFFFQESFGAGYSVGKTASTNSSQRSGRYPQPDVVTTKLAKRLAKESKLALNAMLDNFHEHGDQKNAILKEIHDLLIMAKNEVKGKYMLEVCSPCIRIAFIAAHLRDASALEVFANLVKENVKSICAMKDVAWSKGEPTFMWYGYLHEFGPKLKQMKEECVPAQSSTVPTAAWIPTRLVYTELREAFGLINSILDEVAPIRRRSA